MHSIDTVVRIAKEVGEKNRLAYEAEQSKKGGRGSAKTLKTFKGPKTGKIVERFKESVKPVILPTEGAKGMVDVKYEKVVKDSKAVIDFDKQYKPYIFGLLIKHHGFVATSECGDDGKPIFRNGPLEMECVYHDVLMRLMLGAIDGFDMSRDRVGKGAFRRYLKMITASVVSDALAPDLVPVYKPDGTPEYTDEVVKDKHGKPKLDERGNVIYKQKREYRMSFEARNIQNAMAMSGFGGVVGTAREKEWTSTDINRIRLFFAKCAYLKMTDAKMKSARNGWILRAMLDIFENGKDEDAVRKDLLKRKVIKSAGAFYVAKTRYLNDWKNMQEAEEKKVLKKVRIGKECPRGAIGKDTPLRRGVYEWRPIVDRMKAKKIVKDLEVEVKAIVGAERIRYVNEIFTRIMNALVAEADRRMAEKKGRRFAKIEQELKAERALGQAK